MNLSKFANLLMVGLALTVVASGCKKKPYGVTPIPTTGMTGPKEAGPGAPITPGGPDSTNIPTGFPITDPSKYDSYTHDADTLKPDTVYFAYDSSVVRASEKSKVAHVADYLKSNAANALEVDGHCDERGTEEYNRALGERRALAVREELAKLGIDPSKIVTKTFGKDRPIEPLHSEAAWSKNRRAEFIVLIPPK